MKPVYKSFSDILGQLSFETLPKDRALKDQIKAAIAKLKKTARRIEYMRETLASIPSHNATARHEMAAKLAKEETRLAAKIEGLKRLNDQWINPSFNRSNAITRNMPIRFDGKTVAKIANDKDGFNPNSAIPVKIKGIEMNVSEYAAQSGHYVTEENAKGEWHVLRLGKVIAGPFAKSHHADQWINERLAKSRKAKPIRDMEKINHRIDEALKK